MKWRIWIVTSMALACSVGIAGCGQDYRVSPLMSFDRGLDQNLAKEGQVPWQTKSWGRPAHYVINPYSYQPLGGTSLYKIAATQDNDAEKRRQARNELQDAMIWVSDEVTASHLAAVRATETNMNLALGAAGIGLTGGAAVAGEAAAAALAAAATGVQGTRALVNEQVYRNALTESIIRLITADREVTRQQIRTRQTLPISLYSVEAAIADANVYHLKGSFYHGLALLNAAAEEKAGPILSGSGAMQPATSKIQELRAQKQNLQLQIAFLESALPGRKNDVEKAKSANPADTKNVKRLTRTVDETMAKIEALKAELDKVQTELTKAERDAAQQELKALQDRVNELNAKLKPDSSAGAQSEDNGKSGSGTTNDASGEKNDDNGRQS